MSLSRFETRAPAAETIERKRQMEHEDLDSSSTTLGSVYRDLLDWSASLPRWQQELIRRLLHQETLSPDDLDELSRRSSRRNRAANLAIRCVVRFRSPLHCRERGAQYAGRNSESSPTSTCSGKIKALPSVLNSPWSTVTTRPGNLVTVAFSRRCTAQESLTTSLVMSGLRWLPQVSRQPRS